MKRAIVLHPFVVAVFPALALYTYNVQELSLSELVVPFAVALSLASLMLLCTWLVLRNIHKAALIVSLFLALLYSTAYIRPYGHQNEYYLMVVLFLGAMMGLVFSSNVIPLYVFWEITAFTSWRLMGSMSRAASRLSRFLPLISSMCSSSASMEPYWQTHWAAVLGPTPSKDMRRDLALSIGMRQIADGSRLPSR